MTKLTSLVTRIEKSKVGAQLFRVARLAVAGIATAYVTHSALDTTAVVTIVETAFRQVFPS